MSQWDSDDHSAIVFNDLFDALYQQQYGQPFTGYGCPSDPDTLCTYVPAQLFWDTISQSFPLSADALRTLAHYDDARGGYPWQQRGCANWVYYPAMAPDVTAVRRCV